MSPTSTAGLPPVIACASRRVDLHHVPLQPRERVGVGRRRVRQVARRRAVGRGVLRASSRSRAVAEALSTALSALSRLLGTTRSTSSRRRPRSGRTSTTTCRPPAGSSSRRSRERSRSCRRRCSSARFRPRRRRAQPDPTAIAASTAAVTPSAQTFLFMLSPCRCVPPCRPGPAESADRGSTLRHERARA